MTAIEGYENYTINESGVVINTKFNRQIKQYINCNYYKVCISKNKKQHTLLLHRLIAEAFIPNPDNKPVVDHINRDKLDNRIENLRWATIKENRQNACCLSKTGLQFISKMKSKTTEQGYIYRFQLRRNKEVKSSYGNKDLQPVIEFRNKFCAENDIEINDA